MIEVIIKLANGHILDSLKDEDCNITEIGVVLLRLEQIKQQLISKKFKNKFEYEEK